MRANAGSENSMVLQHCAINTRSFNEQVEIALYVSPPGFAFSILTTGVLASQFVQPFARLVGITNSPPNPPDGESGSTLNEHENSGRGYATCWYHA